MEMLDLLKIVARWAHIGSAIMVVGGSGFLRFVLMPAAEKLPEAEHLALRERIRKPWQLMVHAGITLFILSGFFNYIVVAIPQHRGDGLYHALMGTKMLLAFVVFFFAVALTGRSEGLSSFRTNAKKWLMINLLLAGLIVGISGILRYLPPTPPSVVPVPATASIQEPAN